MVTKTCHGCGQEKDIELFRREKRNKNGRGSICLECLREKSREYRKRDVPEDKSERLRGYSLKYRMLHIEIVRQRRRDYTRATNNSAVKISRAIKDGRLRKPDTCEICGQKKCLVAHHQDYHHEYSVNWLCYSCHGRVHAAVRSLLSRAG